MTAGLKKIQLEEMLAEREARAALQQQLLKRHGCALLSLSMNIAGEIKTSPAVELLFRRGLRIFRESMEFEPEEAILRLTPCGPYALLAYDVPAPVLKAVAICLEEGFNPEGDPLLPGESGRLFDFDIIGPDGKKLTRGLPRRCILCGGPVSVCSRNRAHGLSAIVQAQNSLIVSYAARIAGSAACEALKKEARLTPKPGLVDGNNSGAHKDMDLSMLLSSADALLPHLIRFYTIGAEKDDCIRQLVAEGLAAEKTMFSVTGGVNTHRGAIFLFALVLAAFGGYSMRGGDLQNRIRLLAEEKKKLGAVSGTHNGGCALKEAEEGYDIAFRAADVMDRKGPLSALCFLMAELSDSNLLHRGGPEGLVYVKDSAAQLLGTEESALPSRLEEMDRACIARGLSPGGAADLLSFVFFLEEMKE